jgi:hypothetical protein
MKWLLIIPMTACIFFTYSVLTVAAADVASGIAQLSGCSGPDCTACNVVDMLNGFIKWIIGFMFLLCAVLITVAGVRLVTSGGNSHTLDEAKGMFTNAIIGMIIILAAWLIVDTVIRGLVGQDGKLATTGDVSGWLYWSEVQCQVVNPPRLDPKNTLDIEFEGVIADSTNAITSGPIATVSPAGVYNPSSTVAPDGAYSYQSGVQAQASQASPELQMLMNCMLSQLPGNVGEISAISEKAIANGSKTFTQCWTNGCAHVAGSCHYGNGYGVVGKSYAVDFGDEQNADDIMGAAKACGAGYAGIHNGNHVHVSAAACAGN